MNTKASVEDSFRLGLYSVYLELFAVVQAHPGRIKDQCLVELITWLLSSIEGSWLVVGVTEKALDEYHKMDFQHPMGVLARGHLVGRATRRKALFGGPTAVSAEVFWELQKGDETVIMTREENKKDPPSGFQYFRFDSPSADLFPNQAIGWGHRKKKESPFLRALWELEMERQRK